MWRSLQIGYRIMLIIDTYVLDNKFVKPIMIMCGTLIHTVPVYCTICVWGKGGWERERGGGECRGCRKEIGLQLLTFVSSVQNYQLLINQSHQLTNQALLSLQMYKIEYIAWNGTYSDKAVYFQHLYKCCKFSCSLISNISFKFFQVVCFRLRRL